MSSIQLIVILYQFVVFLFSLSVHECAHAWMASRLGDQTARLEGRISLNPGRHIDPIGTLLYPAIMLLGPLFGLGGPGIVLGWGKPVPINTRNLRKIIREENIIAIAGPAANLLLVFLAFLLLAVMLRVIPGGELAVAVAIHGSIVPSASTAPQAVAMLGWLMIQVNLALIFFNLLPIPPLDASRIVRNFLPYNSLNTFDTLGRFGFIVIFILGRIVVGIFLGPAIGLVLAGLNLFLPPQ